VRCARCGNENLEQNRFCGMCGASLLSAPAAKPAEPQPVSVAASPTASQVVAERAQESPRAAVQSPASSSISGPSFLGLNDPAPSKSAPRKRASLSIDPHSAPGSNLDYLLDEEEPEHHWGIGKILLILIALALAAGFGYLRFKNQGLAWLNPSKKPSAVVQSSPDTTPPASSPSVTPDSQPEAQPNAAAPPQPATAAPGNAPSGSPSATPAAATPAPSTPAQSEPSTPARSDTGKSNDAPTAGSSDKAAAPSDSDKAASPTDKDSSSAKDASPETPAPVTATKPVEKPKPAPKAPTPKPSAASRPVAPHDPVTEAQKYLYGRGAPQDCDRGLRLLRPAANQANPKAMIEMGALYSAGLCTPHDLPTAYRWFAFALRKDPENTAVQADLQKLWGEMTQPERQLAIKLTQ
jgi:Sel1 repeat-containing protein